MPVWFVSDSPSHWLIRLSLTSPPSRIFDIAAKVDVELASDFEVVGGPGTELFEKHIAEGHIRSADIDRLHEFLYVVIHPFPPGSRRVSKGN